MGTGPYQPPAGAPSGAAPADEDSLPAARGEVRDLRRWVIVAGVWAVAASVIAIIALVSGDNGSKDPGSSPTEVSSQIARVQRALDKRIDHVEASVRGLPTSADVSKLEGRLRGAEDQASAAAGAAKDARSKLSDLETRVSDLEQSAQGDGGATTPQTPP